MNSTSSLPSGINPPHVLAVIPARLHSQRLPRKVLRELAGKPLLEWVYEAALACPQLTQVLVAVDSPEVAALCERKGWPFRMTSPALASGTDRLFAVAETMEADLYVNIQGDEPLLSPNHIAALLAPFQDSAVDASTLKTHCAPHEVHDPNAVKVVTAQDGRAMYFSRAPIPYDRENTGRAVYWKHLGLYAYRRSTLTRFATLAPSELEQVERLEQLRLLENGLSLHVAETTEASIGVDTEDDLRRVEAILKERAALPTDA